MASTPNLMDFVQRFRDIQYHRDASDQLMRDVLLYCDKLETSLRSQNQKITDELRECKRENRHLQAQLSQFEARTDWYTNEIDEIRNQNLYILVVIDGDHLLFRDHWIRQGVEGGKKAALVLRQAIKSQCGEHADDVEIIAKVVANLGGVAKALGRDLSDLKDFALGFTRAYAAFDFIDVGFGKSCASRKIKETIRWHMNNCNCIDVIMGIPRDAPYASFLDDISRDDLSRQRLSVIDGASTTPDLDMSAISTVDVCRDLFRTDRHADPNTSVWPLSAWRAAPRTCGSPSATSPSTSPPGRSSLSYANGTSSGKESPPPPPPPKLSLPIAPKTSARSSKARTLPRSQSSQYVRIPPQQPGWNPGPRGLDEPITVSVSAMESIKKRKESDKLCNNHFLRGPCTKGASCFFVHEYKPSSEELNAIAVLARQNPCANGQACDAKDCIYGHHCPNIRDGTCIHPFCKFAEDGHPPGTKFRNPNIKGLK